jgi:asparagine synthase (glutamine-hydrolysing)
LRDKADIADDLKSLLTDSVRLQMRSDVPVGAYLSGGVDSSLMVALASQNTSLPLNTFSVGFENSEFDELPYARQVAKQFNTNHHEIIVSPKDALDSLSDLLWYMDEPIGDSAVLPSYLVSKLAAKQVKVALSGLGGDELFGGYNRYKPVKSKFELISGMPKPLLRLLGPVLELVNENYGKELEKLINPLSEAQKYHNQVNQMSFNMINQLTGKHHDFSSYGKEIMDTFSSYKGNDIPNQKMFTDCKRYMNDQLLHLADRTSMAVSLEARVPFLDPRIVNFASNIPSDLKVNKHDTKIILKEAIKDLLPDSILYRQKWGFAAPHKTWILSDMLQELISQTINGDLVNDGILDKNGVAEFLSDKESVRKYSTWVWPILALELWYKQYKKLL